MPVRIHCPHCTTSFMVMNGVQHQPNTCPRCRATFLPGPPGQGRAAVPPPPSPPGAAPAPLRQPLLGYLMILGSWVLGPGTVFLVHALSGRTGWLNMIPLVILLALGTTSAGWLLLRGRRLVAQHAADVMSSDARPPILLLRSFVDDQMELERSHSTMFSNSVVTFEEALAEVCWWYGPVIAIGRPGETLPPLGAARLWVDHGSWQQKVATLLRDCGAVVMIMGAIKGKDGLAWEVETICRLGLLGKLVLVVPPLKDEAEVKTRWQSYQRLAQGRLPPYQGGETLATFDAAARCNVDRQRVGRGGGATRDRKAYKELLHDAGRRLTGRPRLPLGVRLSRLVLTVTFGVVVCMLFLLMTLWKAEQDRRQREVEESWRRKLYEPPPFHPPPPAPVRKPWPDAFPERQPPLEP